MSYYTKYEYELRPIEAYKVIKNCSGCGSKGVFANTGNFRVNANGNKLDVWLIYQCEKCKHTYNLTVHERVNPSKIAEEEYEGYLRNDEKLSFCLGTDKKLFSKNKAEIASGEINYELLLLQKSEHPTQDCIVIRDPYDIKTRLDKLLCELLKQNRNQVKKLLKEGALKVVEDYANHTATITLQHDFF